MRNWKDTGQGLRLYLRENVHARILHDLLSASPGGLFHAYFAGKRGPMHLAQVLNLPIRLLSTMSANRGREVQGDATFEQEVPLGQLPVKRALIHHYYDVLSIESRQVEGPA